MQIVKIGNRYRVRGCLPHLSNFWIDADPTRNEINIPATGDLTPTQLDRLLCAIQYARDLAAGNVVFDPNAETDAWQIEALAALREKHLIDAVKICRRSTGLGLKVAKTLVDQLKAQHDL